MSKYAYTAIDAEGKEVRGILEAESESDAISEIGKMGLFLTEVHRAGIADGLRQEFKTRVEADRQRREQEAAKRQEQLRKRHPRQRLVVHFADGRVEYGVSFHLNPKEQSFPLDCTDVNGHAKDKRIIVQFSELKAVYYVRSFDGKFNKQDAAPEIRTDGPELVVEFNDGEVLQCRAVSPLQADTTRFFVVPSAPGNNVNILVERCATKTICTPEEYKSRKAAARQARTEDAKSQGISQEETMGDFYFETRNYPSALQNYEAALASEPDSVRIKRKLIVTKYNIAMGYVKRRDYPKALEKMNEVLELDPRNEHALKKMKKLKKIIEHAGSGHADAKTERPRDAF